MAGKLRTQVAPKLKSRPITKNQFRAWIGGDFVANLGGDELSVRTAQEGIARGLVKQVLVYGVTSTGHAKELSTFTVNSHSDGEDVLAVEDDDGGSMIERCDGG